MEAYATTERLRARPELRVVSSDQALPNGGTGLQQGGEIVDELLGRIADLVADKLAARLGVTSGNTDDSWFDTRRAAEYLGVHRDTIRRLAAQHAIPSEQTGAGCKLFFRRRDLDRWRQTVELHRQGAVSEGRSLR
jgi:excisionase family DNA binding protein